MEFWYKNVKVLDLEVKKWCGFKSFAVGNVKVADFEIFTVQQGVWLRMKW